MLAEKNSLPKDEAFPSANANRRLSLANLVSYQIEKKRSVQISGKSKKSRHLTRNSYISEINSNQEVNSCDLNMPIELKSYVCSKEDFDYKDDEYYSSIFGLIAEAFNESETLFQFLKKTLNIVYYTKLSILITILMGVFHLIMVYTGINNLENCPREPKIPVYIFIFGGVGSLKSLQLIWSQVRRNSDADDYFINYKSNSFANETANNIAGNILDSEEQRINKGSKVTDAIVTIFLMIWFVFGNYWIWSIYEPNYDILLLDPNNWCNRRLYLFSLVHLIIYYSLLSLLIILLLFLSILTQIPCLIIKFQDY